MISLYYCHMTVNYGRNQFYNTGPRSDLSIPISMCWSFHCCIYWVPHTLNKDIAKLSLALIVSLGLSTHKSILAYDQYPHLKSCDETCRSKMLFYSYSWDPVIISNILISCVEGDIISKIQSIEMTLYRQSLKILYQKYIVLTPRTHKLSLFCSKILSTAYPCALTTPEYLSRF